MMKRVKKHGWWAGLIFVLLLISILNFFTPKFLQTSYFAAAGQDLAGPALPVITHLPTPAPLKAIYMTACVASTPSWREQLKTLINTTELNAVVIDIKDSTGSISFPTTLANSGKGCVVPDMQDFITELHKNNIYVIGRISVFQDPYYSNAHPELAVKSKSTGGVWKDHKGLSFIDVGAKPYWDYVIGIAKASYGIGFDEINFDYVRYPSDGNLSDMNFTWSSASSTKADNLEGFFKYLSEHLKATGPTISADLFGMTTTVHDDMGIGQVLERALPYFDYIDPMVYPSHFPATWSGFENPAAHPYDVIHISMSEGKRREDVLKLSLRIATSTPSKLRPWLQDFDLGATYNAPMVRQQVQATYDTGLTSWLVWDAGNTYTPGAFLPE